MLVVNSPAHVWVRECWVYQFYPCTIHWSSGKFGTLPIAYKLRNSFMSFLPLFVSSSLSRVACKQKHSISNCFPMRCVAFALLFPYFHYWMAVFLPTICQDLHEFLWDCDKSEFSRELDTTKTIIWPLFHSRNHKKVFCATANSSVDSFISCFRYNEIFPVQLVALVAQRTYTEILTCEIFKTTQESSKDIANCFISHFINSKQITNIPENMVKPCREHEISPQQNRIHPPSITRAFHST